MYKQMAKRKESNQSSASPWFLSRAKDANFVEYIPLTPPSPSFLVAE